MNCELCHENLDACRAGSLPHNMRIQVEEHLKGCKDCTEIFSLLNLTETVIKAEKEQESNPFLSTRIMAAIEVAETTIPQSSPVFIKVIKPIVIMMSLAASIFIGILVGKVSNSASNNDAVPLEMVLINDADIEVISMLSNE